mmetsp:Transcript_43254/g.88510  ORF Transcript_43254/g.88510 Transcript_43254/m.88510 type:complete len:120 (-) Transcript_43254:8-367(-)
MCPVLCSKASDRAGGAGASLRSMFSWDLLLPLFSLFSLVAERTLFSPHMLVGMAPTQALVHNVDEAPVLQGCGDALFVGQLLVHRVLLQVRAWRDLDIDLVFGRKASQELDSDAQADES